MEYIPTPREVKKANYKVKCAYCGTIFFANKCTAKFCSTLCRVKYNNEHQKEASQPVAEKKPKVIKTTTPKTKVVEKVKKEPKMTFYDVILKAPNKTISFYFDTPLSEQKYYSELPEEIKTIVNKMYDIKKQSNHTITIEKHTYKISMISIADIHKYIQIILVAS